MISLIRWRLPYNQKRSKRNTHIELLCGWMEERLWGRDERDRHIATEKQYDDEWI